MRNWCVFYPICVEGVEYCLDVEGLLCRAALYPEDPLELVQVQGTARALLHEHDAQLLDLCRIHLLVVAPLLSHGPLITAIKRVPMTVSLSESLASDSRQDTKASAHTLSRSEELCGFQSSPSEQAAGR